MGLRRRTLRRWTLRAAAGALLLVAAGLVGVRPPSAPGPVCHDRSGAAVAPTRCLVDYQYTQRPPVGSANDVTDGGDTQPNVVHHLTMYLVFWLPDGSHYEPPVTSGALDLQFEQLMQQWVEDVGGTNYWAIASQYGLTMPIGSDVTLGGSYVDATAYPHSGNQGDEVTDGDIRAEVLRAAAANSWPGGQDRLIVVFTANGIRLKSGDDTGTCGFHGMGSHNTFAAVETAKDVCDLAGGPYTPASDGALTSLSHEVFETVTDPLPLSLWNDRTLPDGKGEVADKCNPTGQPYLGPAADLPQGGTADVFLHGHPYLLQQEWSNAVNTCAMDYCPQLSSVCSPSISAKVTVNIPAPVESSPVNLNISVTNTSDTAAASDMNVDIALPPGYTVVGTQSSTYHQHVNYLPPHATQGLVANVVTGPAGSAQAICAQVSFHDLLGGHAASLTSDQCAHVTPTAANATVTTANGYDNMFASYGDTSSANPYEGQWNGGDGAESTLLPNGDTAWFFNDSFYGQVGRDGTRALFSNSQPRNMVVIQHGTSLTTSIAGPVVDFLNPYHFPGTLVAGPGQYSDQSHYNLTGGDGMMVGNTLYKFYTVMDATGGNSAFPDQPVDTALATFTWTGSTLTLSSVQLIPFYSAMVSWGIALLNDGGYTYVYGVEDQGFSTLRNLHIARVPQGQLTNWNAWQFRTDTGWSSSSALSTAIMPYTSEGFSVTKVNGTYVLLTNDTRPGHNPWSAVAYYATTPDGFGTATSHFIFSPPLRTGLIAYEYRIHPQFSDPNDPGRTVLIGYSVNTLNMDLSCMSENSWDASIYRPHFVAVQLPGLGGSDGQVKTNTSGLPSPEYSQPKPILPESEVWHSNDPDPSSWSSTECPIGNPTPAPKPTLHATANADATITLHWTTTPTAMWVYNLYYHDDTADPNRNNPPANDPNCADAAAHGGWCTFPYPMVARNDLTMMYLQPGHKYSYQVVAGKWRSGGSTLSDPASATAYLAKPTRKPTGVRTTAGNGSVTVHWDAVSGAWYRIIMRDGSNPPQETSYATPNNTFTWYNLPAGVLTFSVVESNLSGDGPESNLVTGVSNACQPVNPTPCDHP